MSGGDILREVDEALRVEKAQKFWQEHGKAIIACAVALVLGTAANSGWTSYQNTQAEKATAQFMDALQNKEPMESLKKLSATESGAGSALAGLSAASLSIASSQWDNAMAEYSHLLANKKSPQTYKDLATVQMVALKIDHDDKASAENLIALLAPIIKDKTSAWNSRALFLQALIKANKKQDYNGARDDLQVLIANPEISDSFLEQIKALDNVYTIKGDSKK